MKGLRCSRMLKGSKKVRISLDIYWYLKCKTPLLSLSLPCFSSNHPFTSLYNCMRCCKILDFLTEFGFSANLNIFWLFSTFQAVVISGARAPLLVEAHTKHVQHAVARGRHCLEPANQCDLGPVGLELEQFCHFRHSQAPAEHQQLLFGKSPTQSQ